MKASEITHPGLYWASDNGGDEGPQPVHVYGDADDLRMEWLGTDEVDYLSNECCRAHHASDFIGPFPPPGEGSKFEGFKAALEALCRAYGVEFSPDYGLIEVYDADAHTRPPGHFLRDETKPTQ